MRAGAEIEGRESGGGPVAKLLGEVLLGRWLWLRYPGGVVCAASHVHRCVCWSTSDSDDYRMSWYARRRVSNGSFGMVLEMLDVGLHYIES